MNVEYGIPCAKQYARALTPLRRHHQTRANHAHASNRCRSIRRSAWLRCDQNQRPNSDDLDVLGRTDTSQIVEVVAAPQGWRVLHGAHADIVSGLNHKAELQWQITLPDSQRVLLGDGEEWVVHSDSGLRWYRDRQVLGLMDRKLAVQSSALWHHKLAIADAAASTLAICTPSLSVQPPGKLGMIVSVRRATSLTGPCFRIKRISSSSAAAPQDLCCWIRAVASGRR